MTARGDEVLHVLGLAAPGDTTTAAARVLRDGLAREGVPGRLVAVEVRGAVDDVEVLEPEQLGGAAVVVHAVDGGEALAPVLEPLRGSRLHLVHHGSRPGSDRRVLRMLRDAVTAVAATGPSAREELRGLGFGEPAALTPHLLAPADSTDATDGDDDDHPGPHLLAVGPITEGRALEVLVDAFAQLLRSGVPSAVLSICGPAQGWYLDALLRRVVRRGLLACEVLEPADEGAVQRRLARCDVFVSLQPSGLDPYLWAAATRATVVAPLVAATTGLAGSAGFVELEGAPTCDQLADALRRATDPGRARVGTVPRTPGPTLRQLLRVA